MEPLKHECGVAMIRLLKPLEHYQQKYGTDHYALNKLYLLMEKQHNRGQEGAGIACVKLKSTPGTDYMFRERALGTNAITEIFNAVASNSNDPFTAEKGKAWSEANIFMGHLRYSTTGKSGIDYIHPFLRRNNWRAKNLALCGNFNLTNVDKVFSNIVANGQHPRRYADTHIMLEQLGHRLDREVERIYQQCLAEGLEGLDITNAIEDRVDMGNVLSTSSPLWDGGYVMCGLTGSGETFALRDPWGIRTAFWYKDDEIMVLASERPVIQTVLNVSIDDIHELLPGQAILTNKAGEMRLLQVNAPQPLSACSFERIYFSRGSDADIYEERKEMGRRLVDKILPAIDYDLEHTVFSYIPNTAEVAYYGLLEGMDNYLNKQKMERIKALGHKPDDDELQRILSLRIRSEKVAWKDIKLRTFIAEGNSRNDLAAHVYDITYNSLQPYVDNLVIIDDSIVRGTTLKQSIISILDRLHPKKMIIVSSSPQIRYPDFYGIDMSSMDQFIAYKAAVALRDERGMGRATTPWEVYEPFTEDEVSQKIAQLLTPDGMTTPLQIIFQSIDGLHKACPNHSGDWYFTGNFPTPGGRELLQRIYEQSK